MRRLLEPFCHLHCLRDPQIKGLLPYRYKVEVVADIGKPLPSDTDLFDHLLLHFEGAINTFESGDFASSIWQLRSTLDVLHGTE